MISVFLLIILLQQVTPEVTPEATPEVTAEATANATTILDGVVEADFAADDLTPLIGEPIELRLTTRIPPETAILNWPEFETEWGAFELLTIGELEIEERDDGSTFYEQVFDARIWEPGDYQTPETFIEYQRIGSSEILRTPATPLFFTTPSVLESTDLNTLELRPSRPPIGFFYLPPWAIGLIVLVSGAAIWGGRRYYGIWQARRNAPPPEIPLTPLEAALAQLTDLQNEPPEEVYIGTSESLREYLQTRFEIDAKEMTTGEIIDAFEAKEPDKVGQLPAILEHADLIKFGSLQASQESAERLLTVAARWLESAEPEPPEITEEVEV